jgi:hypothetical protein
VKRWLRLVNFFLYWFGKCMIRIEDDKNAAIIGRYHIVGISEYMFARGRHG